MSKKIRESDYCLHRGRWRPALACEAWLSFQGETEKPVDAQGKSLLDPSRTLSLGIEGLRVTHFQLVTGRGSIKRNIIRCSTQVHHHVGSIRGANDGPYACGGIVGGNISFTVTIVVCWHGFPRRVAPAYRHVASIRGANDGPYACGGIVGGNISFTVTIVVCWHGFPRRVAPAHRHVGSI